MSGSKREYRRVGSVMFPGSLAPRAEEFAHLEKAGVRMRPGVAGEGARWVLELEHDQWGAATMACLRDVPPLPAMWVRHDPTLTPDERDEAMRGRTTVTVAMNGEGSELRERKHLLRYLRAVMGEDGTMALDHVAERLWPRAALDDELSHDAELDVESLYALHVVAGDAEDAPPAWVHTHGLGNMGLVDFDVVWPAEDLATRRNDALRAIAFAIIEGKVRRSGDRMLLGQPGGWVEFVDIEKFMKAADPAFAALRREVEEGHGPPRLVVCEPRGWLQRWISPAWPARMLSPEGDEEMVLSFSEQAGELSGNRARLTYGLFRRMREEFAPLQTPAVVKLKIQTDDGGYEYPWFEVHALEEGRIDGTLINEPHAISSMKVGDRAWHDVEMMNDWTILTPLGVPITPRAMWPARLIRCIGVQKLVEAVKEE